LGWAVKDQERQEWLEKAGEEEWAADGNVARDAGDPAGNRRVRGRKGRAGRRWRMPWRRGRRP